MAPCSSAAARGAGGGRTERRPRLISYMGARSFQTIEEWSVNEKVLRVRAITVWTVGLLICGAVVILLYLWIDRPVAYFVHSELIRYRATFDLLARLPKAIGPLAGC